MMGKRLICMALLMELFVCGCTNNVGQTNTDSQEKENSETVTILDEVVKELGDCERLNISSDFDSTELKVSEDGKNLHVVPKVKTPSNWDAHIHKFVKVNNTHYEVCEYWENPGLASYIGRWQGDKSDQVWLNSTEDIEDKNEFAFYDNESSGFNLATSSMLSTVQQWVNYLSEGQNEITVKEDKPFFDMNTSQNDNGMVITLSLNDPEKYSELEIEYNKNYYSDNEKYDPYEIDGVRVSKCKYKELEYVLTLNKDHQLTKYESLGSMDYGDGLVTEFHTIYTIERPVDIINTEKIDKIINDAKSGLLKEGDVVEW